MNATVWAIIGIVMFLSVTIVLYKRLGSDDEYGYRIIGPDNFEEGFESPSQAIAAAEAQIEESQRIE